MADISIEIGSLKLKNPVIIASGPLTARIDRIKKAEENGAAAVSIKHSLKKQQFYARPRWYVEKNVGIIVSGDPRLEVDEAEKLISQVKKETDIKVLANMSGLSTDVNSWGELAKVFEQAGADAIELNLNCPNLHSANTGGFVLGANLGSDPESCAKVVKNVKNSVNIPVIAKLPTEGGRIMQVAASCEEAGLDIFNIHAGFRGAPGLDIYNEGKFLYPGSPAGNFGGCSGPWSRLISNRFIADIATASSLPIIGSGGLSKWEHIVESIMYGSAAIQVCTAVMFEGFEIVQKFIRGLTEFMEQKGYNSIEDFRGMALKNILKPGQMEYANIAAFIDEDKCSGCRKCVKLPTCDAISYQDKKCRVNPQHCVGCGLCVGICPSKAFGFYETLRHAGIETKSADGYLEKVRLIKTPEEVEYLRSAVNLAERAFPTFLESISRGLNEFQIVAEVEYALKKMGAEDNFMLISSGGTDVFGMTPPQARAARKGDLTLTELTPQVNGWWAQICRTVVKGIPNENQVKAFNIYLEAEEAGLQAVKPGVNISDVAKAENDVFRKYGYGEYTSSQYTRVRGHGHGMHFDEAPTINEDVDLIIEEGMVIVVHPNTYNPLSGYMVLGDPVVVTKNGCELLSTTERKLFQV